MTELHQAALDYAARGWRVFPIVPKRKKPALIDDYYTKSSCDPVQINAWWTNCPDANIGLDCGKSGIVAIDVDSKEGHGDGHGGIGINFKGLRIASGGAKLWDSTLISQTPTGGLHFIFEAPSEEYYVKTNANTFGIPGIDTRSQGGYIVLPPSIVPAGNYYFLNQNTIQPTPRKLLSIKGQTSSSLQEKLSQSELIGQGGRDNFLISYLGKFKDLGLEGSELRALVEAAYHLRCDPGTDPYTEEDFDRLVNSAMKWEATHDLAAEVIKAVPTETPGIFNQTDGSFAISASNFLQTYEDNTEWIVDSIFQRRSVNMIMGAPKSGKSTLTKHLALTVAYGLPFLGQWKTAATPVLIYTLQENKAHLKKWLNTSLAHLQSDLSCIPMDFIFRLNHKSERAIQGLAQRIEENHYGLVIIDMLAPFIGVESLDDYTEIDRVTSTLNELAQDCNTTIVWTHHERKAQAGTDSFAGSIGSQAIRGSVYTTLKSWKDRGRRYIATEQRDGEDIAASAVYLDKATNAMRLAGNKITLALVDNNEKKAKLEELLDQNPALSAHDAKAVVGGRYQEVAALLERIRHERASDD